MSKNNEKLLKWTKVIATILLAIAGVIYASGRFTARVDQIEKTVLSVEDNDHAQDEDIVRIETKLDIILKFVERVEKKWDDD